MIEIHHYYIDICVLSYDLMICASAEMSPVSTPTPTLVASPGDEPGEAVHYEKKPEEKKMTM